MYIFGYGSLMNQKSLQKTLPGRTIKQWAVLRGYRRCFSILIGGYLYLSLERCAPAQTVGALIKITKKDLTELKKREKGYRCVNVSRKISNAKFKNIYTFIGRSDWRPGYYIPQSYIATCLKYAPKIVKNNWQQTTVIKNSIKNDLKKPKYANANF